VIASWLGARSRQLRARLVGDPPRAQAVGEVQRLGRLAQQSKTSLATVHQPRGSQ
jgi:hypothetical protein